MPFISTGFASAGKRLFPLDFPIISTAGAARRDVARSLGEERWDNEGGHFPSARPVIASPAISSRDFEALEAQVHDMESRLASDLAAGRVGVRYNSYAHRSRVLRQQKAKCDALRVRVQSQEQRR